MPPIDGAAGNQTLFGTPGDDVIRGFDGADTLSGGDGNDVIYGHSEADLSPVSGQITANLLASGLSNAVSIASTPSDTTHIYVTERFTGAIMQVDTATGAATTFLDIPDNTFGTAGERGVLSVAFHPDYAANGEIFVYLTNAAGEIEIREYTRSAANPLVIDPASAKTIITIPHPTFDNHVGGQVAFGADGYLYLATGDGGSGNDPSNNAQNVNSLLGKLIRIDINGDAFPTNPSRNYAIPADNPFVSGNGADEIWSIGLRNPFRFSFDNNGDLYIGDVGQSAREEVDFQAAGAGRGVNYGWRIMEGTLPNIAGSPPAEAPVLTAPIYDYGRAIGQTVIGGVVQRGPTPGLQGGYLFSDIGSNHVFTLTVENGVATPVIDLTSRILWQGGDPGSIVSFGEDAAGNVYVASLAGTVHKLSFSTAAGDGGDTLSGGNGNDVLYGGAGDDVLSGDAGADSLSGELGADVLYGGASADAFVYTAAAQSNAGGADLIADFLQGSDVLDLSAVAPTAIAVLQVGGNSLIFANTPGGEMQIGALGTVQAADIATGGIGVLVQGGAASSTLIGSGSADTLYGESGNDTLIGGGGGDVLFGGAGADSFRFLGATDSIAGSADLIADFQQGADVLDMSAVAPTAIAILQVGGNSLIFANTPGGAMQIGVLGTVQGADIVTGSIGVTVQGGPASSTSTGSGAGDTLFGEGGNDTLIGGSGADVLFGGTGADSFRYQTAAESGPVAPDLIADFETGSDKIDLRGTGVTAIGIASNIVFGNGPNGIALQISVLGTVALSDIVTDPGVMTPPAAISDAYDVYLPVSDHLHTHGMLA